MSLVFWIGGTVINLWLQGLRFILWRVTFCFSLFSHFAYRNSRSLHVHLMLLSFEKNFWHIPKMLWISCNKRQLHYKAIRKKVSSFERTGSAWRPYKRQYCCRSFFLFKKEVSQVWIEENIIESASMLQEARTQRLAWDKTHSLQDNRNIYPSKTALRKKKISRKAVRCDLSYVCLLLFSCGI